jgi:hypothetical protein
MQAAFSSKDVERKRNMSMNYSCSAAPTARPTYHITHPMCRGRTT